MYQLLLGHHPEEVLARTQRPSVLILSEGRTWRRLRRHHTGLPHMLSALTTSNHFWPHLRELFSVLVQQVPLLGRRGLYLEAEVQMTASRQPVSSQEILPELLS